jgi:hypothetical protein
MSEQMPEGVVPQDDPSEEIAQLEKRFRSGTSWFYWIAGLSIVNSLVVHLQGEWAFVIGLGITQIIDVIAIDAIGKFPENAAVIRTVALVIGVFIAGLFILFGALAHKRHDWAFITGIVLYVLDALLFLLIGDWLGLGFHGLALYFLFSGYSALRNLRYAEATLAMNAAQGEWAQAPEEHGPEQGQPQ